MHDTTLALIITNHWWLSNECDISASTKLCNSDTAGGETCVIEVTHVYLCHWSDTQVHYMWLFPLSCYCLKISIVQKLARPLSTCSIKMIWNLFCWVHWMEVMSVGCIGWRLCLLGALDGGDVCHRRVKFKDTIQCNSPLQDSPQVWFDSSCILSALYLILLK